jgi:hypothetical protein
MHLSSYRYTYMRYTCTYRHIHTYTGIARGIAIARGIHLLYVFESICMYLHVYLCICMYMYVFSSILYSIENMISIIVYVTGWLAGSCLPSPAQTCQTLAPIAELECIYLHLESRPYFRAQQLELELELELERCLAPWLSALDARPSPHGPEARPE